MPHRTLPITRKSSTAVRTFLSKYLATVGGMHVLPLEWLHCPSISALKLRRLSKLHERGESYQRGIGGPDDNGLLDRVHMQLPDINRPLIVWRFVRAIFVG